MLAWGGRRPGRVDQAVAADPHAVGCGREVREHVAAIIVGRYDPNEPGREVGGLGDNPDAGFWSLGAGYYAADVVAVELDARIWVTVGSRGCSTSAPTTRHYP